METISFNCYFADKYAVNLTRKDKYWVGQKCDLDLYCSTQAEITNPFYYLQQIRE